MPGSAASNMPMMPPIEVPTQSTSSAPRRASSVAHGGEIGRIGVILGMGEQFAFAAAGHVGADDAASAGERSGERVEIAPVAGKAVDADDRAAPCRPAPFDIGHAVETVRPEAGQRCVRSWRRPSRNGARRRKRLPGATPLRYEAAIRRSMTGIAMAATGPLSGILVVDLSRILAGPYCTMLMAEMGARVIKVEPPGKGDDAREYGPFRNGKSTYFASINRGKESIALDLKAPGDRAIFERLLGTRRRAGREFPPRHDGEARLWLGDAASALSRASSMPRPRASAIPARIRAIPPTTWWCRGWAAS